MALSFPSTGTTTPTNGKIMVVDDEAELTNALCEMLKKHGYEARGFINGNQALVELNEQSYDVVLADLMMPDMDGISLLRAAFDVDPLLVGIIMTGQGTVQTAVEAMKTGAFDYLLKPFKLASVLSVLSHALEVRRLRRENVQMREMLNIYELGQLVTLTLDTHVIFQKMSEAALQQCQADEVSIMLPDQDQDELILVSTYGDQRERLVGKRVPIEGTVAGWVARHLEPLMLEGEVHDTRFPVAHPRPDIHSAVSMPMILGNRLVGVINVNKITRRRPMTQGQLRALRILVSIAASALENARLYDETSRRLDRLSALRTVDLAITSSLDLRVTLNVILDEVVSQLAVDAAAILLQHEHTQTLDFGAARGFRTNLMERTSRLLGVGYTGTAALEHQTVRVPDLATAGPDPDREALSQDEGIRSCFFVPLINKGMVEGVLGVYQRTPFFPDAEWMGYLEALGGQAAIAVNSARLFDSLQRTNQQLMLAYNATIEGWSAALDLRDQETEGHTQRVTEMTLRLANSLNMFDDQDLIHIRQGALLHDIGKMGVPDRILLKPGPLTPTEKKIMHKHPEYAYQLLSPIAYLRKALDIPYSHHERWNGSGYPQGLKGKQIPLVARIFAVVDVWDALRSDRPYRKAWPEADVLNYLRERAGIDFDPEVVKAFLKIVQQP